MNSFIIPQFVCRLFGIIPWINHSPRLIIVQNIIFVILYALINIGVFGALILLSNDIGEFASNAFFCGSALFELSVYVVLLANKQKITAIFSDMSDFVDESEWIIKLHHFVQSDQTKIIFFNL